MNRFIVSHPKILGGMPVIAGSRVPIARILYLLKEGYTIEGIRDEFPHVSVKNIKGAVNELINMLGKATDASKVLQTQDTT